jgi:hypothetical protein
VPGSAETAAALEARYSEETLAEARPFRLALALPVAVGAAVVIGFVYNSTPAAVPYLAVSSAIMFACFLGLYFWPAHGQGLTAVLIMCYWRACRARTLRLIIATCVSRAPPPPLARHVTHVCARSCY